MFYNLLVDTISGLSSTVWVLREVDPEPSVRVCRVCGVGARGGVPPIQSSC